MTGAVVLVDGWLGLTEHADAVRMAHRRARRTGVRQRVTRDHGLWRVVAW